MYRKGKTVPRDASHLIPEIKLLPVLFCALIAIRNLLERFHSDMSSFIYDVSISYERSQTDLRAPRAESGLYVG